jgi:hypothetical protein
MGFANGVRSFANPTSPELLKRYQFEKETDDEKDFDYNHPVTFRHFDPRGLREHYDER